MFARRKVVPSFQIKPTTNQKLGRKIQHASKLLQKAGELCRLRTNESAGRTKKNARLQSNQAQIKHIVARGRLELPTSRL